MDVIPFARTGRAYSVYVFVEDSGRTALEQWFDDNEVPAIIWAGIFALWDIYENCGPFSIRASTMDLGSGFYGVLVPRKGSVSACPIFRFGPFDEETEITFLAGAKWDDSAKRVRPYSAVGTAEENLEVLLERPHRRRRG